jgi:hypothetical protein
MVAQLGADLRVRAIPLDLPGHIQAQQLGLLPVYTVGLVPGSVTIVATRAAVPQAWPRLTWVMPPCFS